MEKEGEAVAREINPSFFVCAYVDVLLCVCAECRVQAWGGGEGEVVAGCGLRIREGPRQSLGGGGGKKIRRKKNNDDSRQGRMQMQAQMQIQCRSGL